MPPPTSTEEHLRGLGPLPGFDPGPRLARIVMPAPPQLPVHTQAASLGDMVRGACCNALNNLFNKNSF